MEQPLALANLTIYRQTVRFEGSGGPPIHALFEDPDLDVDTILNSSLSIHRVTPNTYDLLLTLNTVPPSIVDELEQNRANQRATAFESVEIEDDSE